LGDQFSVDEEHQEEHDLDYVLVDREPHYDSSDVSAIEERADREV
jgi:hypothetical protein